MVFIPTASVAAPGDHGWFIEDLSQLHGLRWREFDILELNGLPGQLVLDRLRHADVIYAEGGNHYHLANSIIANGLAEEMADILEDEGLRRRQRGLDDLQQEPVRADRRGVQRAG